MHLGACAASVVLSLGLAQAAADRAPGTSGARGASSDPLTLEFPLGQVKSVVRLDDREYSVVLCRESASRLQDTTSHNAGRTLLVVIDGVALDTATIVGPIVGGYLALRVTSEDRRALVERLVQRAAKAQGAAAKSPSCD